MKFRIEVETDGRLGYWTALKRLKQVQRDINNGKFGKNLKCSRILELSVL